MTKHANFRISLALTTYEGVQSLGIKTLRNIYAAAGLAIKPKTKVNRLEQLKEIIRSWGENPEEILSKDAFTRSNQSLPIDIESHQLQILTSELRQIIRKEVTENNSQK